VQSLCIPALFVLSRWPSWWRQGQ